MVDVFDAIADTVLVVDANGNITRANQGALQLTGFTLDELLAIPVSKLLVDDSSGLRTGVRRRVEGGDVLRREETWLITAKGERIPVSITGSAILGDGGALQGIVLVARDIREMRQLLVDKEAEILRRRKAEEELRSAKASIEEQLEQSRTQLVLAERRATLGTLAGGVGHELRNIAQIQVAAVDDLRDDLASGADLRATVGNALPDLERVAEHIMVHGERLMRLARPGPERVGPFDLHNLVLDVVVMLGSAGKLHRIEVGTSFGDEQLVVTVNRTRIEQILVNLIVNAVDAIGANNTGTIKIEAHPTSDGQRVVCRVSDSGSGIPPDQLAKIFEPFFTTKGDHGTGLGLPVAREIVQSYGGDLTVESAPGTGTTFTFDLPR